MSRPLPALLLLAFGCPTSPVPTDTADTAGDTGDLDDTGSPGDTVGPDLPACTASTGSSSRVALSGVLLTPDGPEAGLLVYDRGTGLITCVGASCTTEDTTVVCTEGVISPGLVDPHNHLQYNSMPPWQVGPEFENRYDWQADDRYDDFKTAYNDVKDTYKCEIMQWAEAREIVHGTTSAVGSSGSGCIERGVRNLDEDAAASHLDGYDLDYSSGNVTSTVEEGDGASTNSRLASGSLDAALNHVAEGRNGSVRDEVDHMIDMGMTGPGQVYVHATDVSTEQLLTLGLSGTGLVWSPRSNLVLYATTTPVEIAENLDVPWAIGTDWTPSGSVGQPQELACAEAWLAGKGAPLDDVGLWAKATEDAARLVGADGVLGVLREGAAADVAVFDWQRTPYRAVIGAPEPTVRLVVVDGEAIYGRSELVDGLAEHPDWCDSIDACGATRTYCQKGADSGELADTLADVQATLDAALARVTMPDGYAYAGELFGLFTCVDDRDTCDLRAPAEGDEDGDGIPDTDDVCAGVYDPNQWDTDADGLGDSCDRCPTVPGEDCSLDADDRDGDGVANADDNCPDVANDQADADGDGTGDACDACPELANPGGAPCPGTVAGLHAGEFADGDRVGIEGVVVTAVRSGSGFFVQVPGATEYGGLYVFDAGAASVSPGDVVTLEGTVTDYYGLLELTDTTVFVTGSLPVPDPLALAPCDVAADPDPTESMLVRFTDLVVTDENADAGDGETTPDYDEYVVNDCLRVDDFLDASLDQLPLGTHLDSLTGVMLYSFDNPKVAPRSASDLE
jgi:cytosine/adenosine deaminase-related metal-dependent hydrolase